MSGHCFALLCLKLELRMFNDVFNFLLFWSENLTATTNETLYSLLVGKHCFDNVQVGCLHPISCWLQVLLPCNLQQSWQLTFFLYLSPSPAMVFALLLLCLSVYVSVCPSPVQLTSERDKLREAEKSISERNSKVGVLPTSPSLPIMLKAATCLHL